MVLGRIRFHYFRLIKVNARMRHQTQVKSVCHTWMCGGGLRLNCSRDRMIWYFVRERRSRWFNSLIWVRRDVNFSRTCGKTGQSCLEIITAALRRSLFNTMFLSRLHLSCNHCWDPIQDKHISVPTCLRSMIIKYTQIIQLNDVESLRVYSSEILSSTTVFNIDNNHKWFLKIMWYWRVQ